MHPPNRLPSSCLIFFYLCVFFSCVIVDARSLNPQSTPSLRFQLPPYLPRPQDDRWLLTKVRDGLIQAIWGLPSGRSSNDCHSNAASSQPLPPPSVLARYDAEVVLRFYVHTVLEIKALAEAINVLFLDVWEFNSKWVDIRLAKDVVGDGLPHTIEQVVTYQLLGSFTTWTSSTILATFAHTVDA